MSLVYAWGASKDNSREHLFQILTDPNWKPVRNPRSCCGNARSAQMPPAPVAGLPRCRNCQHIADLAEDNARTRALRELAQRFAEEFAALFAEEMAKEGLR